MNELQPGIEAEMAVRLREADASMRLAAAGVQAAQVGIVGLAPMAAVYELFRAFPTDDPKVLLAIEALQVLHTHNRWSEQNAIDHCNSIIRDQQSSPESVAMARVVVKALEDRSGLLRAGTPELSGQDELLRPAHDAGYTDPNTLVRAAANDSGAEADPLEEDKGSPCDNESTPTPRWQFWKL